MTQTVGISSTQLSGLGYTAYYVLPGEDLVLLGEGFFGNGFLICQVRDVDGVGFTFKYAVPPRSSDMLLRTMERIGIGPSSRFWTSARAIP